MQIKCFLLPAATLAVLLLPTCVVAEPSPKPVFDLINERLLEMEGVALYKAQNGLAVEDKLREKVVIAKAKESAEAAGLDPDSVVAFYQLQIQAAKAIQYRYLADWTFDLEASNRPAQNLVTEIRPALIALGDALVGAMKTFLEGKGCFREDQLTLFLDSITVEHLGEDEKRELFASMSDIDLAHSEESCKAA